ncbi:hypothetical protein GCM10011608_61420 [Micromonospora sonchi]|uniref:Uncharacterized protein n=2 Tax=Micromonospora sonchi TaxID=1763543 RepID=A0A917X527_9ACTN|nr:hypothetical protein GCM10011608_61420 [Micromonospora sonchi]
MLGGGSSSNGDDPTAYDFERARDGLTPYEMALNGSAGVARGNRLLPWGTPWVRTTAVLVGHGIAELQVNGRRLPIPYHGHLIVVWGSRRPPTVTALDGAGRRVATATCPVSDSRQPPLR